MILGTFKQSRDQGLVNTHKVSNISGEILRILNDFSKYIRKFYIITKNYISFKQLGSKSFQRDGKS